MNQYFGETIKLCSKANLELQDGSHNCHRNWAFAYYKIDEKIKAIKQISIAVKKDPRDPYNWIVWGIILRSAGKYL